MLSNKQFNILFYFGLGCLAAMLFGPEVGLDKLDDNPVVTASVGGIVTYILTQKQSIVKDDKDDKGGDGG